jgi:hypothetical protein
MLIPSNLVVGKPALELWFELIAQTAQVLVIAVGALWAYNRFFSRRHVRVHAKMDVMAKRVELKDGPVIKIRITVRNVGPTRISLLYQGSKCRIDGMTGSSTGIGIPSWKPLVPDIPLFEEDYNKLTPPAWYAESPSHDERIAGIRNAEEEVSKLSTSSPVDKKKLRRAKNRLEERRNFADQFLEAGEESYEEQLIRVKADEGIVAYRVFTHVCFKRAGFSNIQQTVVIVDGDQPSASDVDRDQPSASDAAGVERAANPRVGASIAL